jgi:UDP-N-acetylmuramoyl-tripeptide--D-alanyl-D-alanine ligase
MKELGDESAASHRRVGASAAASGADVLAFFGEEARDAYLAAKAAGNGKDVRWFDDYALLERDIEATVRDGDLVLVKASRSMALERLVERLTGTGGHHVP